MKFAFVLTCLAAWSAIHGCAPTQMTVDSNVRMPGEMASTNRQLTSAEQAQVIQVMEESAPPNSAATRRPLAKAGEFGRWSDASKAATAAAKSRETAVVSK